MNLLHYLKKYSFYIFAITVFLFFTSYKFFPFLFDFKKTNNLDYKDICTDYINDNYKDFESIVYDNLIKDKVTLNQNNNDKSSNNENTIIDDTLLHIDLSGAVNKPGVYSLKNGSRVKDLIKLGEGFNKSASSLWVSRNLNLSSKLFDTQKVYVPFKWETYGDCDCIIDSLFVSAPLIENYSSNNNDYINNSNYYDTSDNYNSEQENYSNSVSDTNNTNIDDSYINVNNDSTSELQKLSGVGPAYAQKIIDNRPYIDITDFESKSGIPNSTIQKNKDYIVF